MGARRRAQAHKTPGLRAPGDVRRRGKRRSPQAPGDVRRRRNRLGRGCPDARASADQKTNAVEDLDDLTQSSETASEDCELPHPNYENILLLIEQLRMECKDSVSLLKIQDAVCSFQRLIEIKKSHCELHTGKILRMENKVSGLKKELSETKEVKAQLEHEKVEWEQELCNLRFTLKQEEEKRRNADWLYEKLKQQLREKEEQYNKEMRVKQQLEVSLRMLDMELKTVRKNLKQVLEERNDIQRQLSEQRNAKILQDGVLANHLCQQKRMEVEHEKMSSELQEAQNQHTEAIQHAEKLQDRLQKLELENANLRITIKKQAEKNEQLQKNLFNANLDLLSMKTIQKECEKLEKNKKKLEQKVVNLKTHIEKNMVERSQVEEYKQEMEERARQYLEEKLKQVNLLLQTQAESQYLQQLRENNSASIRGQMELRIKDLESELSTMKIQEGSNKKQLEIYQEICLQGFQITKLLSGELNKTSERLKEVSSKVLEEKQQNRPSGHSALSTGPDLESPCVGNPNCFILNRSLITRENVVVPQSSPWPPVESVQNYEIRMQRELQESITREIREATAELDSGSFRVSCRGIANKSSQDLLSEAAQEYAEILKRRYMI